MNALTDRALLVTWLTRDGSIAAPTGTAYIAADGTMWHQFTSADIDDEPNLWVTTRVKSALDKYTWRITSDTMDLEEAF